MRPRLLVLAFTLAALALALVATSALGDDRGHARATLSGFQETPQSLSSPGHAQLSATIDDENNTITYSLTIRGLPTPILFAHIHFGQRATTGGVAAFLCGGGSKPAACSQDHANTGTITPADVIGPAGQGIAPGEWNELVAAMRAGFTYANVHTMAFPGGEIRGQIHVNDRDDHHD